MKYKTIYPSCLIIGLICLSLVSVGYSQSNWDFGVKFGYTRATQVQELSTQEDNPLFYPRSGINISGFAERHFNANLFLLGEIAYNQKGSEYKILGTIRIPDPPGFKIIELNHDNRMDFISFIVALGYRFNLHAFAPYFFLGPRIDHLIRNDHILNENSDNNTHVIEGVTQPVNGEFAKNIYGVTIAVGIEFIDILPINTILEITYNKDISAIHSNGYLEIINHTYEIRIGIKL